MLSWYFKLFLFKRRWKKHNKHNFTHADGYFDLDRVTVGKNTYGGINVMTYNKEASLKIGQYCSVGPNVCFVLSADHYLDKISTYPFKVKCLNEPQEGVSKGDIIVDDDVWIGYGATILSGVHIGQGAVIAAGAVVSSDIPPYAIAGGVPAKVIRYRFEPNMIEELLKIDYSKLDQSMIEQHIDDLYTKLSDREQLEWLPKR